MTKDYTPSPQDRFGKAVMWAAGGVIAWNLLTPEAKASIYSWLGQFSLAWQRETERRRDLQASQQRLRRASRAQPGATAGRGAETRR